MSFILSDFTVVVHVFRFYEMCLDIRAAEFMVYRHTHNIDISRAVVFPSSLDIRTHS